MESWASRGQESGVGRRRSQRDGTRKMNTTPTQVNFAFELFGRSFSGINYCTFEFRRIALKSRQLGASLFNRRPLWNLCREKASFVPDLYSYLNKLIGSVSILEPPFGQSGVDIGHVHPIIVPIPFFSDA